MMTARLKLAAAILLFPYLAISQISGTVTGWDGQNEVPLPGANIYWQGTEVGTTSNSDGAFEIPITDKSSVLVASFIGYQSEQKNVISRKGVINFSLKPTGDELGTVEVIGRVDATIVDLKRADLTYKIDDQELRKAPCCNLSESFETNATVDATFTDAVTGQKQIEMLGLSGKYALIQRENIPFARGLNAPVGLSYMPGPFVSGIQLTKGLSSVVNGFESITGQINADYFNPESSPPFYVNAYANQGGRMELNVLSATDVGNKWATGVLAHASQTSRINDVNSDGFVDIPTGNQLNFMNRWQYRGTKNWESQIGVALISSEKKGGQTDFVDGENPNTNPWGYHSKGHRMELFGKAGYFFKNKKRSLGQVYNYSYQTHTATYGQRVHQGEQNSFYYNAIFQEDINTKNALKLGASIQVDDFEESLFSNTLQFDLYARHTQEWIPGVFAEYVLDPSEKMTIVAGIRADYNSLFENVFITPRLNLKYDVAKNTTLRLAGGRGQRTPIVINETQSVLTSSRVYNFNYYGELQPEVAWNMGASVSQNVILGEKVLKLNADAFYTWFESKLIADLDADPTQAVLLNAHGSSSFSFLAQADYPIIKNLDLRLAYKYLDAKENYLNGIEKTYLLPTHRAFLNLAYATVSDWKFDATLNWFGEKRLPKTTSSPIEFQQPEYSDSFFTLNFQVNKSFKKGLEVFAGVDNILDYRQENPIVNAENPNDLYFDSQFTWAPIFGRTIYAGLHYTLPKKAKK